MIIFLEKFIIDTINDSWEYEDYTKIMQYDIVNARTYKRTYANVICKGVSTYANYRIRQKIKGKIYIFLMRQECEKNNLWFQSICPGIPLFERISDRNLLIV